MEGGEGGRVIRESALWNVVAFWRIYLGVQIDHQAVVRGWRKAQSRCKEQIY